MSGISIRKETEADFNEIYNFVKSAFSTAKVSDGDEQNFVNRLRASGNYIPELSLVAEYEGKIVGHIMLSKANIDTENGKHETLILAPLAVDAEFRSQGLGAKLVEYSFVSADELGYKSVFLVGDPDYYGRFGFIASNEYGIINTNGIADEYVLAKEIRLGSLNAITSGKITLPH